MKWLVRLDDIPVDEARLYLVFVARPARREVTARATRLLAASADRLAGLVTDFGFEHADAAYIDIDRGLVPDELAARAERACESFVKALDKAFPIAAVSLEPRIVEARAPKQKPTPIRLRKNANQLAAQLMRLTRKQEIDALCPSLNTFLLRNAAAAGSGFARAIAAGNRIVAKLVEDMDANPRHERFKVRVGDGIVFGLIAIHEAMGNKKKMQRAARRFLAIVDKPRLARAYAKQIAFARARV